jgi:hypothetical protein
MKNDISFRPCHFLLATTEQKVRLTKINTENLVLGKYFCIFALSNDFAGTEKK